MTPPLVKQHLDRKLVLPILRFITLGIRGMDLDEFVRSVERSGYVRFQIRREGDLRPSALEVPQWMFDRAACAAMALASRPCVSVAQLRCLKALLISLPINAVVENQHPIELEGVADGVPEQARTPNSVRAFHGRRSKYLGKTAPASSGTSLESGRQVDSGSKNPKPNTDGGVAR